MIFPILKTDTRERPQRARRIDGREDMRERPQKGDTSWKNSKWTYISLTKARQAAKEAKEALRLRDRKQVHRRKEEPQRAVVTWKRSLTV